MIFLFIFFLKRYLTKVKKCIIKYCYPINKKLSSEIKLYKKKLSNKCKNLIIKYTIKNKINLFI